MDVRQAYNRLVNFKKHISCVRKTKGGINRAIDWWDGCVLSSRDYSISYACDFEYWMK